MSILQKIVETKKEEVKILRAKYSLENFKDYEFFNANSISLKESLRRDDRLGIIAEIKKASPSKGILKNDFDYLDIANIYMQNKVDAISILTDKKYFQGDIKFIADIAQLKTVPLLRKDFIIDEYQVFEAKAFGADAILLISEILSKNQINELTAVAKECSLEVLLEIHSEAQLGKINLSENDLIGVNNRDLDTFEINTGTSLRLAQLIPDDVLIISESGLNNYSDIIKIRSSKIKGVLVGEHFMKSEDIKEQLMEFIEWCKYES